MGQGRSWIRLLVATAVGLLALAATGTAGAAQSCGSRLVDDWRDGRIDNTYPVACYRQALKELPEDVRVYSSAQADITRALQTRLAASPKVATTRHSSAGVSPLLVVAITAAVLVAAGSVAAAVR
jgi:hypothetical protein